MSLIYSFMRMSGTRPSLHLLFYITGSFFIFLFFPSVVIFGAQLVRARAQEGFISLDCGLEGSSSYLDKISGINYVGDSQYTVSGKSHVISNNPFELQYATLRSFPNGTRNCYSLSPVQSGQRYLVRAGFYYGNYDGRNVFPSFDIRVGVNFWTSVGMLAESPTIVEIVTVPRASKIEVCLVNTEGGTPFISLLELRPFLHSMYPFADENKSLLRKKRWNYGTQGQLRFPSDPYDRIWEGVTGSFDLLKTTELVQSAVEDAFQVPSAVLQTAVTANETGHYLESRPIEGIPGEIAYIVMHFAELVKLNPANESRELIINGGDDKTLLFAEYSPPYLTADHKEILHAVINDSGVYVVTIDSTKSSTHWYMINALESFIVRPMNESQTEDPDVVAIEDVKKAFGLTRNWESDPCSPRQYMWEGVGCSYEASASARITSLNLSSSGLEGVIPSSIGNLKALETLDLSNNNLNGPIPEILGDISSLKILNLLGNQAIGSIPESLCDKVSEGSLSISGGQGECRVSGKSSNTKIIFISVAVCVIILVFGAFTYICYRRSKSSSSEVEFQAKENALSAEGANAWKKDVQFKFAKISNITRNFKQEIGLGGFGVVYYGMLDQTKVAVKVISSSSSQGSREFEAEVLLLTRVHHKNLVRLLGYCDEKQHLSLVYEYMDNGNVKDHLSDTVSFENLLNWEQRVSIALQAAQGLDYLHNGCRPPIIHRDIKSSNILLNSKFVAKIGDFGLSRAFCNDSATHISTRLAGTPGYLDPEYYQSYRLNEKSDVYSFGVVLLELLTGQPPYKKSERKTHIVQWVRTRVETGDISNIVDPRLQRAFNVDVAWHLVDVALSSTSTSSADRIVMGDALQQLKLCMDKNGSSYYTDKDSLKTSHHPYVSGETCLYSPSPR
ncbi:putative LRR receptor-like serine/threonine-protein kinase At1g05700 [Wolffia australiana]